MHRIEKIVSRFNSDQKIRYEWSLRIAKDNVSIRDKFIIWFPDNFDQISNFMALFKCPLAIIERQRELSGRIVNLGLGISRSDEEGGNLYLHYLDKDSGHDKYEAFIWKTQHSFRKVYYRFFFYPKTHHGITPEQLIHDQLYQVYTTAIKNPLLKASSGFWLRNNAEKYDQVCISYPWLPRLKEILTSISCFSGFDKGNPIIRKFREYHFKHLAFNTNSQHPHLTIYFSGECNLSDLRKVRPIEEIANENTEKANALIKQRILKNITLPSLNQHNHLGEFYNTKNIAVWKKVLGDRMHYHFGLFDKEDDLENISNEEPFDRAIDSLIEFIPEETSIYDMGCGWGGPAKYLKDRNNNRVTSITISETQFNYCNSIGVTTRLGNMENTLPPGYFDSILMIESLEHIKNKFRLLKNIRYFTDQLVIRTHCQNSNANNIVFGGSMHVISSGLLEDLLKKTGWKIKHIKNKREESLPTIDIWKKRLKGIPIQNDYHFEQFRAFTNRISEYPEAWGNYHPLMEIVAM